MKIRISTLQAVNSGNQIRVSLQRPPSASQDSC